MSLCAYPFKIILYLVLHGGEGGRKRGREALIGWLSHAPQSGDQAHNPGKCLDREPNLRTSAFQRMPNQLSHAGQGSAHILQWQQNHYECWFGDYKYILVRRQICKHGINKCWESTGCLFMTSILSFPLLCLLFLFQALTELASLSYTLPQHLFIPVSVTLNLLLINFFLSKIQWSLWKYQSWMNNLGITRA